MRKTLFVVLLLLLGWVNVSKSNELLHKSIITGLDMYQVINPIQSADGKYNGFIGVDRSNDRVDIFDSSGEVTSSIPAGDSLITAIANLRNYSDTLAVYMLTVSHQPWPWSGRLTDDNLYTISIATISGEDVSTASVRPECYSTDGQIENLAGSLEFETDNDLHITGLIFHGTLKTSLWEATMGVTVTEHVTYAGYDLNLDSLMVREAVNYRQAGYFGGTDKVGVARSAHYYKWVDDPPFDIYTDDRTNFSIYNDTSRLASITTSRGSTKLVQVGEFVAQAPNEEVIYGGYSYDLLGLREGASDHWACYAVNDSTVSEIWWRTAPWKFDPYFYFKPQNAIVGIVNGLSINLLSCRTGIYIGMTPLEHIMYHRAFLVADQIELPYLFGVLGDSVYVYRMDILTDVDDVPVDVLPESYSLEQNYPNPFNPSTTIEFNVPTRSDVRIIVYDILGRQVASLIDGSRPAGRHSVRWNGINSDGSPVATGVYFYSLEIDGRVESKKMLLLK